MARIHGKPVRLLASRLEDGECNIYCLNEGFVNVLLDLSQRLEWGATWLENDLETRATLSDAQQQLIEEGIEALTMACEIVINNTVNVPPIEVNVTGGGGGDCPVGFPTPVDTSGEPVATTCVPLNPEDPLGETEPTWDEGTETPPDGWEDWQEFIDARCLQANYFVDSYVATVGQLDEIENQGSLVKNIMEIALVIIALMPGPAGDSAGILVVMKWVSRMLLLLTTFLEDLEDVNDYLQLLRDEIVDNKEALICQIYWATDVDYIREFLRSFLTPLLLGAATPAISNPDAAEALVDYVIDVGADLAPLSSDKGSYFQIPLDYVPGVDCSQCVPLAPDGYVYIPASWDSVGAAVAKSSQVSVYSGELDANGDAVVTFEAPDPGRYCSLQLNIVDPPSRVPDNSRYVGFGFTAVNVSLVDNALLTASTSSGSINDDGLISPVGQVHLVRGGGSGAAYPTEWPGVKTIRISNGTNIDTCTPVGKWVLAGGYASAAGTVIVKYKKPFWIARLGEPC